MTRTVYEKIILNAPLSLEKSAKEWAEYTNTALAIPKKDTTAMIKDAGYDITENARKLQSFYLNVS